MVFCSGHFQDLCDGMRVLGKVSEEKLIPQAVVESCLSSRPLGSPRSSPGRQVGNFVSAIGRILQSL